MTFAVTARPVTLREFPCVEGPDTGETLSIFTGQRPNDAPDLPLENQTVQERALPGETGAIDSAGFFGALKENWLRWATHLRNR